MQTHLLAPLTNTDAGGVCTFCGKKVALNYRGGDDEGTDTRASGEASSSDQQPIEDAATAAAIAFKNRLVEYDRNRWVLHLDWIIFCS